jgi:diguanylate cyclase (GGDEF)-like protein
MGNESAPPNSKEPTSDHELSVEDQEFLNTIYSLEFKIRENGDEQNAHYLMTGLRWAGERLWEQMKAGENFESLRELWKDYYRQQGEFASRELVALMAEAINQINSQESNIKNLTEELVRDALTGLYNRKQYQEDLEKLVEKYQKQHEDFTLVMLDLNGFKVVNDTFGHFVGNQVLKYLAKILEENIREQNGDRAYRWGGDEFALLIHGDSQLAINILDRISEIIKNYNEQTERRQSESASQKLENTPPLGISFGMASASEFKNNGELTAEGIFKTDDQLYKMKEEK